MVDHEIPPHETTAAGLPREPGMLAVARAVADREGVTINWQDGRAEALPFPDGSFDLVLCQYSLMFFADRPAATSEMARVLARGGRLAASVFQPIERHPFYQALDAAIERHAPLALVRLWRLRRLSTQRGILSPQRSIQEDAMAGKPHRSGGQNAVSLEQHRLRGTVRRHRHLAPPTPARPAVTSERERTLDGLPPKAARIAAELLDTFDGWTEEHCRP